MPADAPEPVTPPPSGDSQKAESYLDKISKLIAAGKISVSHTDLSKFDPCSIQDHYRAVLSDYEVEISHTKQPDTSADYYICLFNNLKKVQNLNCNRVVLAYIHLSREQFIKFKEVADEAIEKARAAAEKARFEEAMKPIDQVLEQVETSPAEDKETTGQDINLEKEALPDKEEQLPTFHPLAE